MTAIQISPDAMSLVPATPFAQGALEPSFVEFRRMRRLQVLRQLGIALVVAVVAADVAIALDSLARL